MTRAALLVISGLAAVTLLAGCLGGGSDRVGGDRAADARVLTILDPFSNGSEVAAFDNEVARLSNGALRIRVVDGTDDGPGYEAAAIRAMQGGRADLAIAGTRAWDQFGAKRLRALDAPLLIDSYRLEGRVLASEIVDPMLKELRPLDMVGIGILPGPIRRPFGTSRRLAAPSDFSGTTIGTQQSRVADATMRALGATPRRLPADERDLPRLDGIERQARGIEGDRLEVEGSHLTTNVDLWPRALVVFASERSYGDLSRDEHRILRTAAANVVRKKAANEAGAEVEAAGNICRTGHTTFDSATPAELGALRRAVGPVYRDLERDPRTRAAIHAIERLKRQVADPPAVVPGCRRAAGTPASNGTTKLDGVWTMDTDRSAAVPEYSPENWGHWVFVFDRGSFAITQENKPSCTWGYGKFTVDGNRTSWTFTDGGGIAPSGATNKPSEFFVFDLSAYRDTLTLAPVKGQISPLGFRAKPWRRVSDTPTRRYFSKRCPPPAAALPD
jgi:TRAP-type C4-dicarboxylate transport system substrate-binding protein